MIANSDNYISYLERAHGMVKKAWLQIKESLIVIIEKCTLYTTTQTPKHDQHASLVTFKCYLCTYLSYIPFTLVYQQYCLFHNTCFTDHPLDMMRPVRIRSSVDLSCAMNLSGMIPTD